MSDKMRFIIKNKEYFFNKENILNSFQNKQPRLAKKYYVEINDKKVGIKEAIYETIEIPKIELATNSAKSILKRLGFEIKAIS